jgi:hypothetical protein
VNRPIAIVEPQMEEFYHAPFNAALLHAMVLAYPDASVSFRSFPSHAHVIRGILDQNAPGLSERIVWRTEQLPRPHSARARWMQSRRSIRENLRSNERILYSSISRMGLMQLKGAMRKTDTVRAVFHGDLDQIETPSTQSFPRSLFTLERILLRPHPPGLRYLFLSRSIQNNIPPRFRQALANSSSIDHPYHFFPLPPAAPFPPVFGIFGNCGDGELLRQVASTVKAANPNVRFRLVGFLSNPAAVERLRPFVDDASDQPLSRDVFVERAKSITHALWLAPPNSFRMRASGTFFDALSYAKPILFTANQFIDPYFAQEPRIGYRCETVAAVATTILALAASNNTEAYKASVAAMERFRSRFTPDSLGNVLPDALAWD